MLPVHYVEATEGADTWWECVLVAIVTRNQPACSGISLCGAFSADRSGTRPPSASPHQTPRSPRAGHSLDRTPARHPLDAIYSLQFVFSGFDEVYALWALSTRASGGLDWTSQEIGQVKLKQNVARRSFMSST